MKTAPTSKEAERQNKDLPELPVRQKKDLPK